MLKRLLKNYLADGDGEDAIEGSILDREQLRMLVEHFPIGRKIRYFPEFQRDIVFQTIVVAYRVNEHLIYSRDGIRCDAGGLPAAFVWDAQQRPLEPEHVTRFQLMVPDTSDMERSLDYIRRANLGRAGQFVRGNAITLIAETCQRGVPSLDTQVDGRIALKDGPYLDSQMILLRPDFETLRIADQRQKARVSSDMAARLFVKPDAPPAACVLADFSDVSLRLKPGPSHPPLPVLKANEKVVVELDFGDGIRIYRLRGVVFRSSADFCVVRLRQLWKDGQFVPIQTIDVLEIKTGLLNHGG
jgi:hypothetical protein